MSSGDSEELAAAVWRVAIETGKPVNVNDMMAATGRCKVWVRKHMRAVDAHGLERIEIEAKCGPKGRERTIFVDALRPTLAAMAERLRAAGVQA